MFLIPSDFTGEFKVGGNTLTSTDFQIYINKYERIYLMDLLGVELYNLFIADLDVNFEPQTPIYQVIYDEIFEDDGAQSGCQYRSLGIIEMLKGFIYYHWLRDQFTEKTITGAVKNEFSNSQPVSMTWTNIEEKFNESGQMYDTIQWYIKENISDYPTYNGLEKSSISWL